MSAHAVKDYYAEQDAPGERWKVLQVIEELKSQARQGRRHLEPLHAPAPIGANPHVDDHGSNLTARCLTNVEYALCAEEMGRVGIVVGNLQLRRRLTRAIWKCSTATAPAEQKKQLAASR